MAHFFLKKEAVKLFLTIGPFDKGRLIRITTQQKLKQCCPNYFVPSPYLKSLDFLLVFMDRNTFLLIKPSS